MTLRTRLFFLLLCCSTIIVEPASARQVRPANDAYDFETTPRGGPINPMRQRIVLTGPWPVRVPQDPGNELSGVEWAETMGRQLFSDKTLSGNGAVSCATCHKESRGFTDGLAVAQGIGKHVRNTQGLLNAGLQSWFGWDGGTDSLWAASLRPMLSDIEMGGNIESIAAALRKQTDLVNTLGTELSLMPDAMDDESIVVLAAKAIGAYLRTLSSPPTTFDAYREALQKRDMQALEQYPASAKRGMVTFFGDANCWICHFGPDFSNGEFHDIGRPFFTGVGQVDPGRYTGIDRVKADRYNLLGRFSTITHHSETRRIKSVKQTQSNFGQWRTPSIRNLTLTAPYMHDGSLETLRDVVDFYADMDVTRLHVKGESLLQPLDLDESGREDLVRFLETLSPSQ